MFHELPTAHPLEFEFEDGLYADGEYQYTHRRHIAGLDNLKSPDARNKVLPWIHSIPAGQDPYEASSRAISPAVTPPRVDGGLSASAGGMPKHSPSSHIMFIYSNLALTVFRLSLKLQSPQAGSLCLHKPPSIRMQHLRDHAPTRTLNHALPSDSKVPSLSLLPVTSPSGKAPSIGAACRTPSPPSTRSCMATERSSAMEA